MKIPTSTIYKFSAKQSLLMNKFGLAFEVAVEEFVKETLQFTDEEFVVIKSVEV